MEDMAAILQFGEHKDIDGDLSNAKYESKGGNNQSSTNNTFDSNEVTTINALNAENSSRQQLQQQLYISLQSPSREDNPILSFPQPPDFISLKPLTPDEEKAILMQVKFAIQNIEVQSHNVN